MSRSSGEIEGRNVSVIIPNLNSPIVDRTIESVRGQRYAGGRVQILVVGPDAHGLVREDNVVSHLSRNTPLAPASARNRGAAHASGEYLVFIDADCVALPGWLEKLIACIEEAEGDVVCGGMVVEAASGYWTLCDNLGTFHEYLTTVNKGYRTYLPSFSLAMKHDTWAEIGGFDESFHKAAAEDLDLTVRLHTAGFRLLFEPHAKVRHFPQRHDFSAVMRHSYVSGQNSIIVRLKYARQYATPSWMRIPATVTLLSPLAAVLVVLRMFVSDISLVKYVHTAPVVFLAKVAWCLGAADTLRHRRSLMEAGVGQSNGMAERTQG